MLINMPLKTEQMELEGLLSGVAAGERDALARLYCRTRAAAYALALSILHNDCDAQDVTQDVFVRVWENAPQYRPQGSPMAWLLTIARNESRMKLRRAEKFVDLEEREWLAIPADAPHCHAGGPAGAAVRHVRPVRHGAAGGAAPRGGGTEAPGDCRGAGAASGHRPVKVPQSIEKTESLPERR